MWRRRVLWRRMRVGGVTLAVALALSAGVSADAAPSPTALCASVSASAVSRVVHRKVVFVPYKGLLQNFGNGSFYATSNRTLGIAHEAGLGCVYEGFPPFLDVVLEAQRLPGPAAPFYRKIVEQTTYDAPAPRAFRGLGFPAFEEVGVSSFYYPLAGSPIKTDTSFLSAARGHELLNVSILNAIPVTEAQLRADAAELGPLMRLALKLHP